MLKTVNEEKMLAINLSKTLIFRVKSNSHTKLLWCWIDYSRKLCAITELFMIIHSKISFFLSIDSLPIFPEMLVHHPCPLNSPHAWSSQNFYGIILRFVVVIVYTGKKVACSPIKRLICAHLAYDHHVNIPPSDCWSHRHTLPMGTERR